MNKIELKQLLDLVSAVDGRNITAMTIEAWHPVVASISLTDGKEALVLARADASIGWVEPKHIVAKYKIIAEKRAVAKEHERWATEVKPDSIRCPDCKHGVQIVKCAACCRVMSDSTIPNQTFFELTGVRV